MNNLIGRTIFLMSVLSLVCSQVPNQNCTSIINFSDCNTNTNCQWTNIPTLNQCIPYCSSKNFFNNCLEEDGCTWVNQQPGTCAPIKTACKADFDIQDCQTQFCTFTKATCSAIPDKCTPYTTATDCGTTQCSWTTVNKCQYNQKTNACATLVGAQCAAPFCQQNQVCVAKPQDQIKGQVADVDCSQFAGDQCTAQAECQLSTTCDEITTTGQGCDSAADEAACTAGQFPTFCSWNIGTCSASATYCADNCDDEQYCIMSAPSKCEWNSKSTACANLGKIECSSTSNGFCSYNNIVPAYCNSNVNCGQYEATEEQCGLHSKNCYFMLGGQCTTSAKSSSFTTLLSSSISLILLALIAVF